MRWQDKAVTVTAAEHRIPEYWFPFQRNMKTYDIHGLKNSKFIPRKLLWPRRCGWAGGGWEDRPAGELRDQDSHVRRFRRGRRLAGVSLRHLHAPVPARARAGLPTVLGAGQHRSQGLLATTRGAAPAAAPEASCASHPTPSPSLMERVDLMCSFAGGILSSLGRAVLRQERNRSRKV